MKAASFWKWVGYATALLSLAAGVGAIVSQISDRRANSHQIDSLLASEKLQTRSNDYASAWRSLDQAEKLNPDSADVRDAQENLAMLWLENISIPEGGKFSDITDKLDPVLTKGVTVSKSPQHQADLESHLGWSYFLRSREGSLSPDPAASYADAVRKDTDNPYAQSMWGHWILWNHGSTDDATTHFSAALASNRERAFVRRLQLSAFLNSHADSADEEIVRIANAIRKEQGTIPADIRQNIFSMYYRKLIPPDDETPHFINAVPPGEHVATFHWLFDNPGPGDSNVPEKTGDLSVLEEAAGQRAEAKAGYDALRRQLADRPGPLLTAAEAGSKRLAGAQ
jgi:tetratricopeptide (TPR) repeat protein